jgi:flagellar motor switch protein FliG
MEAKGAVKLSVVVEAQQNIISVARRLEEEGNISRGGKGGEELIQ